MDRTPANVVWPDFFTQPFPELLALHTGVPGAV